MKRTHVGHGSELSVYTLAAVLGTHGLAPRLNQVDVPRSGGVDPCGERADQVRKAHTERRIFHAETSPAETGNVLGTTKNNQRAR